MLEEVRKTKEPILITKFGRPVAEIVPPSSNQQCRSWLGSMEGEIQFLEDIVAPVFEESDLKERDE